MSLNQLSMLLGLPDSDLKQIVSYANTLSKAEAADHFKNLLGDAPQAIEFITSFNSRRQDPKPAPAPGPAPAQASAPASASGSAPNSQPASGTDAAPKRPRQNNKKKKANIHTPAPRQVIAIDPGPGTVYHKNQTDNEYIIGRSTPSASSSAQPSRTYTPPSQKPNNKSPPSAAGSLISDRLALKSKPKLQPISNPTSRSSTPGPSTASSSSSSKQNAPTKTKVSITGGTPMHGASGAVADLDAAIRALEITTNPSLSSTGKSDDNAAPSARRCNCVGTRHPLQTAAPNCLHCGKVVCLKEGLGPCTFCGNPLLSPDDVQALLRELKGERTREKQAADREAHRRPDVASAPRAFTRARTGYEQESAAEARAAAHRDKLLNFQAQNARRTTVRDEAADFDVAGAMAGTGSMWASPEERARELKRQQKLLREMEWHAQPEYDKRQQVVSIDLVGGKVVKKFVAKERPRTPEDDEPAASGGWEGTTRANNLRAGAGGAFSRNPLLGSLIKPVYDASGSGNGNGKGPALEGRNDRAKGWRRVQDDLSNNEDVILDGGVYGGGGGGGGGGSSKDNTPSAGDEPNCG